MPIMQNCEMQHHKMVKYKENLHTEHGFFAPLEFIVILLFKFLDQKKENSHTDYKQKITNE